MKRDDSWHVTPSFLSNDTTIFRGCTKIEMIILLVGWMVFWFSVMGAVSSSLGGSKAIQGLSIMLGLLSVYISAELLQILKTGKPDGFYQHRSIMWAQKFGLFTNHIINRSAIWDIKRTEEKNQGELSALEKFIKVSS